MDGVLDGCNAGIEGLTVDPDEIGVLAIPDRPVDLDMPLLVMEVMGYENWDSDPEILAAYVIAHRISERDAMEATLVFDDCVELLVDVQASGIHQHGVPAFGRIRYSDDPKSYLASMYEHDVLQDIPAGGIVHESSWRAFCDNLRSGSPLSQIEIRMMIAEDLGLPIMESYERIRRAPTDSSKDVDHSYLSLVLEDASLGDSAHSMSDVEEDSSNHLDGVVPVDPSLAASEAVSSGIPENGVPAGVDLPREPEMDPCNAALVDSSNPSEDTVLVDRRVVVARRPATGRHTFPAISRVLEAGLPVHGDVGEDLGPTLEAFSSLRSRVPWMSGVVDVIEEEILVAWASGEPFRRIHPILITGPSGAGKTRFCRMLADTLRLRFAATSLAGSVDNKSMEGTASGWLGSRPSWPSLMMCDRLSANPMLLVDEVEKVDSTYNGDPRRTLISMMDPESNGRYPDIGLDCEVDLSRISWVLCCNEHRQLDVALRDRLRIMEVVGPTLEHIPQIVSQARMDVGTRLGVDPSRLPDMGDMAIAKATAVFRTSKSMRAVARCVDDMMRERVVSDARRGIRLPPPASLLEGG